MNNPILDHIIEQRKGHYCHYLEVSTTYDIESTIEAIIDELSDQFKEADVIAFFESMDFIYWPEDGETEIEEDEEAVRSFSVKDYITGTVD